MRDLRDPKTGCGWDLQQTPASISRNIIEEAYECFDAISEGDQAGTQEELGDLLLQVIFQSQMASEAGDFTLADVARGLSDKLIRRHPHIFGTEEDKKHRDNPDVILRRWDEIKAIEKKDKPIKFHGPPVDLALKGGKSAAHIGLDWDSPSHCLQQVKSEIDELEDALAPNNEITPDVQEELGDIAFTLIQLYRKCNLDFEAGLRSANAKFRARLKATLPHIKAGLSPEAAWQKAKSEATQR